MTPSGANAAQNLFYAESAVSYVKSKVTTGAGNRWDDVKKSWGWSAIIQPFNRIAGTFEVLGKSPEEGVKLLAARAEREEVGNCAEQSALAFVYLDNIGLRPLEWMGFDNADHGYVVIGRIPRSGTDVMKWGPNAVISDPWLGKAYRAVDLPKHWPGAVPGLILGHA